MTNVKTEVTADNKLVITVDLQERNGRSKSGKSTVIASTQGNQVLADRTGSTFAFGLNVYTMGK